VINVVFWTLSIIPAVFAIWQVEDKATAVAEPAPSVESDADAPREDEKQAAAVNA
jgi:hypothetical protein